MQPAIDLWRVVAGRVGVDPGPVFDAAALGVVRPEIQPPDAGEADGLGTHGAWLQRYIEVAFRQAGRSNRLGRCANRQHFGMGRGVVPGLNQIVRLGKDRAIRADQNRANGNLTRRGGCARLGQSELHGVRFERHPPMLGEIQNLLECARMRVVHVTQFGPPEESLSVVDLPDPPPPSGGDVVIDVLAFPINPADLLLVEGKYAVKPALPSPLGAEGLGRVVAVGPDVQDLAPGDRVMMLGRDNWCSRKAVAAATLLKLPPGGDPLQLAMLKVNPATALEMLRQYVPLSPGDWVVQNAANSAVGRSLIALAKPMGIKTVNIVRREGAAADIADLKPDAVLVDGPDLPARIREACGGNLPKLGIDAVAGDITERMADGMADGGVVVNYGLLSGDACTMRADQLIFRQQKLAGFWLGQVLTTMKRAQVEALYLELADLVRNGVLHVPVEATYPLEDIRAAAKHANQGQRTGKVLVLPNGDPNG